MFEYIRESIETYQSSITHFSENNQNSCLIDDFNNLHQVDSILLKYGWIYLMNSTRAIPDCNSQNNNHRCSFYSKEYDLRIDIYCNLALKTFTVMWYLNDYEINSDTRAKQQNEVDAFAMYSILKYGGCVEQTAIVFKKFKNGNSADLKDVEYKRPPPPLTPIYLTDDKESDVIKALTSRIEQLNEKVNYLQRPISIRSAPELTTQLTQFDTFNQTDGSWNQQYSQARYMDIDECTGLLTDTGIPLGFHAGKEPFNTARSPRLNKIYYQDETHLLTIAPTGSGKNISVQIPTLLEYKGSIVVIDPKGECAVISARHRKTTLGQKVIIINPFDTLKEEFNKVDINQFQSFNPLAFLDSENDNFVADVSALAEALVVGDNIGNSDPYWTNSARDLIVCIIMYVCISDDEKENKHLVRVREILTLPYHSFIDTDDDIPDGTLNKMLETISNHAFIPMAQKARRFLTDDRSNSSVISTAISNTLFIDDPKIAKSLKNNDFDFKDLKKNKITVYIILPAKFLLAYSRWFRLLITSALDTLMSEHKKSDKPVLFMLDEFPILGRMASIETAVGLARGYGIQLWMFLQDIHQLRYLYKEKAESFLANTGMQQYFVPNDIETAERISKRMGNTTLIEQKVTSDSYRNYFGDIIPDKPLKIEMTHKERPLSYPIEIMSLDKDIQIVFFSGNAHAVLMTKNKYYENDDYQNKYDNNPYFVS